MMKFLYIALFFTQYAFSDTVSVIEATYGANCPGVSKGNVTRKVRLGCASNSPFVCDYFISVGVLGDPARGCPKDFELRYLCSSGFRGHIDVPREANGRVAYAACTVHTPRTSGIRIISATYGGNGGVSSGNVSGHIRAQCNGFHTCKYVIDHRKIGDPIPYFRKDYVVTYDCGDNIVRKRIRTPEASGSQVLLSCN